MIISELYNATIAIAITGIFALCFRAALISVGQTWAKSLTHSATILMLPIVTLFVTKIISGNIALSLGMVGALSIVRFRHPVRSPLELTSYFALITAGILGSSSVKYLLFFSAVTLAILFGIALLRHFCGGVLNFQVFANDYLDGSHQSVLRIQSNAKILLLEQSNLTVAYQFDGVFTYELQSEDDGKLKIIANQIADDPSIISLSLVK